MSKQPRAFSPYNSRRSLMDLTLATRLLASPDLLLAALSPRAARLVRRWRLDRHPRARPVEDVQLRHLGRDLSCGDVEEHALRRVAVGGQTEDKALALGVTGALLAAEVGGCGGWLADGGWGGAGARGSAVTDLGLADNEWCGGGRGSQGGDEDSDGGLHPDIIWL